MIQIKDINIKYQNEVISNASISVPDGKITSIIGESGSGKTSLLYMLGLLSSQTCQYEFDGVTIDLRDDKLCSSYRKNKIGYIFQDNNINDQLTIYNNIKYVALISGESIDSEKVKQLLQLVDVNIDPHSYPNKLSVGERQRIAIACAISKNPSVIIADEPTSSLDEKNANLVMKIFREFVNKDNRKVIIATHSREIYEQTEYAAANRAR